MCVYVCVFIYSSQLQSEHDGQVRQLQEQLSASTVRVSNLVAQRDLLRHQLEAVEKVGTSYTFPSDRYVHDTIHTYIHQDIQLAQESQEKGRVEMAQKEARFRDQMDQLSQSNQSAAQSLKGVLSHVTQPQPQPLIRYRLCALPIIVDVSHDRARRARRHSVQRVGARAGASSALLAATIPGGIRDLVPTATGFAAVCHPDRIIRRRGDCSQTAVGRRRIL